MHNTIGIIQSRIPSQPWGAGGSGGPFPDPYLPHALSGNSKRACANRALPAAEYSTVYKLTRDPCTSAYLVLAPAAGQTRAQVGDSGPATRLRLRLSRE